MSSTHRSRFLTALGALALAATLGAASSADAQGWGDRLKKKASDAAKRKVEDRTERRAGDATDKALDTAECKASDRMCRDRAAGEATERGSAASGAAAGIARPAGKPGEGAWRNYDFVPGTRVIFSEDFGADEVGDFPKRLRFKSGNIEVVEWQGSRFLSTHTFASSFSIPLPETLPERFTLEFDYSAAGGNGLIVRFTDPASGGNQNHVDVGTWSGGVAGGSVNAMGAPSGNEYKYKDVVFPVRVMADGQHVKVYMGDTRVANVPNANLGRSKAIWFVVPGRPERAAMIGNIRVAAGGKPLYDALSSTGRVATQGIYFDTGSDRIRPESTPTLTEIGRMLESHAELKVTIEGHTDDAGEASANLALSQKRAEAVKAYLASKHGVDASRLSAKGLGATRPAAPNTTAEGRQQNRRVELVRG